MRVRSFGLGNRVECMVFTVFDTRICLCLSTLRDLSVQSFGFSHRVECMVFSVCDTRICVCRSTLPEE